MAEENYTDLFGNTTKTPKDLIKEQVGRSIRHREELYKNAQPVDRAAAIWGAGLGSMLRGVLQEKGIIDKDPEVRKAEQSDSLRKETESKAKELGIKLDPQDPAKWVEEMSALGLQAIGQANEDGSPKYPDLQDLAPKLMERYMQSQAARKALELKNAQLATEKGKPEVQASEIEKNKAQAAEDRDKVKTQKIETKSEFNGKKWQDYDIDKYGKKTPVGKPYDMDQKLKGKGKSENDNPTFNTALRAFNGAYNFTENFGLREKTDLPSYNRGLSLIGKYLEEGMDPLKAGSRAAAESRVEHLAILNIIRQLQKEKVPKNDIIKTLKESAAKKGIDIDAELYFKK